MTVQNYYKDKFPDYYDKKFLIYEAFNNLGEDLVDIDAVLLDIKDENFALLSGDFYGIQKFIFEGLASKNAAKVLRAKSAYVDIFANVLAKFICHKFNLKENRILSINAGKFEILLDNFDKSTLESKIGEIQKIIDDFFIKNFYGLSGINLSFIECTKSSFDEKNYKNFRDEITEKAEEKKFNKFSLTKQENFILNYDENIDNQSLCKICNIRKIQKENCAICSMFIELGKCLASDDKKEVSSKNDLLIKLEDFDTKIKLSKKIKSYVLKDKKAFVTFEELAKKSCEHLDSGVLALGVLKADVDGMGNFIKNTDVTKNFRNFDIFSKTIDAFFSLYIPSRIEEKFPNIYTVFAGGDDLFLIGAWDEILSLARFVNKEFKKFANGKITKGMLTISFGISIIKASMPINRAAKITEHLLEESKAFKKDGKTVSKDAITMFGQSVSWESYEKIYDELYETFKNIEIKDTNTAFFYRLLDFCDMSIKVKDEKDVLSTMWKSKIRYAFTRNHEAIKEEQFEKLSNFIDKNPKETKIFLSEFI